jgi:CheY-like chemotaxis protein
MTKIEMNTFESRSQIRILTVDDALMSRKMVHRGLKVRGYTDIEEAEDGLIAIEKYNESVMNGKPFDVILMDYQMPNLDGPSATKHIIELGFHGIILGLTGNALPVDIEYFIKCGAKKVFLKPVDMDILDEFITQNSGL